MSTGNTTHFVLTQDLNGVTLITLGSGQNQSEQMSVAVSLDRFRLHPKAWCKGFTVNAESDAQQLAADVSNVLSQMATPLSNHAQNRAMIKSLEDMLITAIEEDEDATISSLTSQIETLEQNDDTVLQQIKSLQDAIEGLYGKSPDQDAAIVQLDLKMFRVNDAFEGEPVPTPPPPPPEPPDDQDLTFPGPPFTPPGPPPVIPPGPPFEPPGPPPGGPPGLAKGPGPHPDGPPGHNTAPGQASNGAAATGDEGSPAIAAQSLATRPYIFIDDAEEESPGAYVWKNDDDDDGNMQPDNDDPSVTDEDDLAQIWWFVAKPIDDPFLSENFFVNKVSNVLSLWSSDTKGTGLGDEIEIDALYERDRAYIEATGSSNVDLGEEINCTFSSDCQDKTKKTACEVEFVKLERGPAVDGSLEEAPEGQSFGKPRADETIEGGEFRLFPGSTSPNGNENSRIRIRLKVKPERHGMNIYVRTFDPDDPSADFVQFLDDEHARRDNRHSVDDETHFAGRLIDEFGLMSDPTSRIIRIFAGNGGNARVDLDVSDVKQPGNNFRVVVGFSRDSVLLVDAKHPDEDAKLYHVVKGQAVLGLKIPEGDESPSQLKQSPLLTIWRKMHLEVDFMGDSNTRIAEGTVQNVLPGGQTIDLGAVLHGQFENARGDLDTTGNLGRYENGELHIFANIYQVEGNTKEQVILKPPSPDHSAPAPQTEEGKTFFLFDDDDTLDIFFDKHVKLDFGLIQESDDPTENVFADAYIVPVIDGAGNAGHNQMQAPFVPFQLNSVSPNPLVAQVNRGRTSNQQGVNSRKYWIGYLQSGWQGPITRDNDSDDEVRNLLGATTVESPSGTLVFTESCREAAVENSVSRTAVLQQVLAHELAHQLAARDKEGLLMGKDGVNSKIPVLQGPTVEVRFSHKSLRRMRNGPLPQGVRSDEF